MKTRIPRKLKKKYKKMGIWPAYLNIASIPVMSEDEFNVLLISGVLLSRDCKTLIIK